MSQQPIIKICDHCKVSLSLDDFYRQGYKADGSIRYHGWCRNCILRKNRPRVKESHRRTKIRVLSHYSPNDIVSCRSCEFDDIRGLMIDHINGDGAEHRKEIASSWGHNFLDWLERNGFPEGYQVLCFNCHHIKTVENGEYKQGRNRPMDIPIHRYSTHNKT